MGCRRLCADVYDLHVSCFSLENKRPYMRVCTAAVLLLRNYQIWVCVVQYACDTVV